MPFPTQIDQVSVPVKANVYFDGKVVSHTLLHADGSKQTLGLIQPGEYRFSTGAPERMDIVAGNCRVRLAGLPDWSGYASGESFDVPGDSAFEIAVDDGLCEYLCSFL
ncbi:MAG TPA: pyrimidine/purine nucleoside phosphorylase [Plasticicumulans sp.]|uniref:pyrimidine/purine nucleoside phosphorylase n=1 Tax=Plasticicumulans sp. TaxID=2307179 RepID=UPI002B74A440|nr:pyrimidine/purine nucleoside phosphorylase [Plasticicumulans sp.]HMV39762.1 pyrimidine/purine nucleoside phosphorylase [Plasticicumulans sp.]HMW28973.1 pyrimidine/purine nucleoside phosphorylase [Plasticicumulans sp.]HMX54365.1 pyrimidine/purine nucleoside phosphorylase [Plasticicumulans sp.]HMZ10483.1 pyrimidine/purine nucleoside phosphorylase [Plasticicumulans sp.]HNB90070.1 pyrimidine/purine nucleoside phosphorylase [Plasticicumulans sp.]